MNLVVIDGNEKTSIQKVYNQDKVVHWIRQLENEGGYRWFDPFSSTNTKRFFLLILHFTKVRDNRANRHPGHLNRRRTSIIISVRNGSGRETDETDTQTDTANDGKVESEVMNSKTDTASEGKVDSDVMSSKTDTASEWKVDSDVMSSKTDTASEGEV